MKRSFTVAVLAAIVAALSPSLSAQWPLYPASGVPKGPDGKPDLTAPAPRTADGKPDLSGIWMSRADAEPNGPPAGRPPPSATPEWDSRKICLSSHGRRSFKGSAPRSSAKTTLMGCASPKACCSCTWIRSRSRSFRRRARSSSSTRRTTVFARARRTAGLSRPRGCRSRTGTVSPSDDGRATRSWSKRTITAAMDGSMPEAAR